MSDDDSMISDEARFTRQRRNVMLTGSILWALQLTQINIVSLLPNHITPGAPRNLEVVWAIVMSYFLWRLSQVSHEFRAKRRNQLRQVLPTHLTRILLQTREVSLMEKQIRYSYEPDKVANIKSISFSQNHIALKEFSSGDVKYELSAAVDWGNGSISIKRVELIVKEGSLSWWRAALQTRWSLGLQTTYFTEYTLPYLVGGSAVVLAFYRYWFST